ncbi:MAG: PorV/PorQ family protein, partial [Bacteroidales bacterium]|nr:PorV/PorQ family protein [Bacteroidales bacterium]
MIKRIYVLFLLFISLYSFSQTNNVEFVLPILDINTNARLGGFGEVGVVSSSFYRNTGVFQNPALISKHSKFAGINYSHMPWLRNIIGDININGFAGYFAIDSSNAIAVNFTYFDLGELTYTNEFGEFMGTDNPCEYYFKFGYNHSFNKFISTGIALKYFRSDIVPSYYENAKDVNSIAFDLGFNYDKKYKLNNTSNLNTSLGVAITNFGPKVSYVESVNEFLPTKLLLGLFINPDINIKDLFRLNIDLAYQAEKYLVPTPPIYDIDGNILDGYNSDISSFRALYQSFYDAPGGFEEEINELKHKFGSELRISFLDYTYIAFRHGRHLEHETKGNRNYQTF